MHRLMLFNPVTYGVDALRQALYCPDLAPDAIRLFSVSLLITLIFAILMLAWAIRRVSGPMFKSK